MKLPIYTVDAFTINNEPFTGNGAADDISDEIKQKIASEMNLSETAFVTKAWTRSQKVVTNTYTIRWFSPFVEVPICGHATQASAAALYDRYFKNHIPGSTQTNTSIYINFITKFKGIFIATINTSDMSVTIDLPLPDVNPITRKLNSRVVDIIRHTLGPDINTDSVVDIGLTTDMPYILLRLRDGLCGGEPLIHKVSPDFTKLAKATNDWNFAVGVIVTEKAQSGDDIDFYSRFFAPNAGINEDPVCGSAHTVLMPYWDRLFNGLGDHRKQLIAKQCSQRGGLLLPIYTVDAFTINNEPFTGNGAADDISDEIKQKIASEMNLSETAFVAKAWTRSQKVVTNTYTIRWFTPLVEVPICGHATQASAAALYDRYFKHHTPGSTQANSSIHINLLYELPNNSAVNVCRFVDEYSVVFGQQSGEIQLIDVRYSDKVVKCWQTSGSPVLSLLAFRHKQRNGFFAGRADGSTVYHYLDSDSETFQLSGPDFEAIYDVATDGTHVFTACRDHCIRKYDLNVITNS
ncbi:unnamed protein product [Oppiella nova]|uniref:Uncharacterized protein n=1 Tax=Oppiella nova TaxID=334625 RepID=A0A7R9LPN4_9ACAR|nr:unnamed protein product [Oppiella nova]CAG2165104.1 unnamed protein product [Oppiella nova]